ncbi:MAG: M1 family metallopeptidase [Gemmatimonas sp.]|uniref:M1 family metallopeptidase n=1 Tax=Gemmatimonas sp. TaxID=1962908 RepID=UPI0031C10140|nr:M1 family metallopeptidase [Gemmatimonas sp.]
MRQRKPMLVLVIAVITSAATGASAQTLPNQGANAPRVPVRAPTTPPGGDTTGYWQQRADYQIVATLDETRGLLRATGTLHYVNASPDTLRELWLHQHLNAFRPNSRWSQRDSALGVKSFQSLAPADQAFERFTGAPRVGQQALKAEYPLSPDSSVVRLRLPRPLLPGKSINVQMAWEARPSALPRRQGRRGRHYDFAQWFPKVAVYDRQGWHPNAFVRQGELYGEFGTFDVTFVLPRDQVIAPSGVPVSGDPGWARVQLPGSMAPRIQSDSPAALAARAPAARVPATHRAVRFVAQRVHHFGFSVSPDYRYEGSHWVRSHTDGRAPDTVALHVLHESWEPGRTMAHLRSAMQWLEGLYGAYAWPQLTIAQRIEESGTEFPMLVMNGEEDPSLVVHEAGHQFTYGLLANNEWQSAWLDEGFTTYSEYWARGEARVPLALERADKGLFDPNIVTDSSLRRRLRAVEQFTEAVEAPVALPDAPPIGLRADLFANKDAYDAVVYDRAAGMYSALHDVLGDAPFRDLLRRYYARWTFKHVDRWALQKSAEDVTGASLDWFFGQWIDQVGTIDYRLDSLTAQPDAGSTDDRYLVTVQLQRMGVYRHPMSVGVQTAGGWTVLRGDPARDRHTLQFSVRGRPLRVWLDPFGTVESRTTSASRLTVPPR